MDMRERRATNWRTTAGVLVAAAGFVLAGCGGSGGEASGPGPSLLDAKPTATEQKSDYLDGVSRVLSAVDDPSAPPLERSISLARANELEAAAMRWDQGLAMLKALKPPATVKAEHDKLVEAMAELGDWNHRIADAAPNRKLVAKVAQQARTSPSARKYGAAIDGFSRKGYDILGAGSTPNPPPIN